VQNVCCCCCLFPIFDYLLWISIVWSIVDCGISPATTSSPFPPLFFRYVHKRARSYNYFRFALTKKYATRTWIIRIYILKWVCDYRFEWFVQNLCSWNECIDSNILYTYSIFPLYCYFLFLLWLYLHYLQFFSFVFLGRTRGRERVGVGVKEMGMEFNALQSTRVEDRQLLGL